MGNFIILGVILMFYLIRILLVKKSERKYLYVSFFIFTAPFELTKVIGNDNFKLPSGTLGSQIIISIPIILSIAFLLFFNKINILKKVFLLDFWIKILFFFILVSILNPFNSSYISSFIFFVFVVQYIILFNLYYATLTYKQVIEGLYDGFKLLSIIQIILAICFPILKMNIVTGLFHTASTEWSTRLGTRDGAVGLFVAPGNLAIFCMIAIAFFLSSYQKKFNSKFSLLFILLNLVTIFLTYSRTAYLSTILMMFVIYFVNKNPSKNVFSIFNFLKIILPISIILIWVVFYSPISDMFIKSDGSEQYENRMIHWLMALKIFSISPLVGVGLNSHLSYLSKNYSSSGSLTLNEFFTSNPIHNIHLIILSEIGLLGLITWIFFLINKFNNSRINLINNKSEIISLTSIGIITTFTFYGFTGWAPFSGSILPYFLFFIFYSTKIKNNIQT